AEPLVLRPVSGRVAPGLHLDVLGHRERPGREQKPDHLRHPAQGLLLRDRVLLLVYRGHTRPVEAVRLDRSRHAGTVRALAARAWGEGLERRGENVETCDTPTTSACPRSLRLRS